MPEQQLTIFDVLEQNIFDEINQKLNKYGIDNLFEKDHLGKSDVFSTIIENLCSNENYDEYILNLYEELKKFVMPVEDARDYFNKGLIAMSFDTWSNGKKFITINIPATKNYLASCGPCFCLKMLGKHFLEAYDDKKV